ncbi:MAG: prepilin-type N-terminal cleavage/methylation domain-containing protein [Alphaproteobacteria bacterium]|nr:prepilin-type N-terminal cleavage/methylation domain-containing protein [Alphaproteobacteria bacterium]
MRPLHNSTAEQGYTLVELSVVIAIVAVLVGSTLMLGTARIDQQKVDSTKDRMALIERALKNYAEVNGRLPCPGDPRLTSSSTNYGKEASTRGDCTTGTIATPHDSGNIVSGSLPFLELALPTDLIFDNWGRKFTYAVDKRYTATNSFAYNAQNSTCGSIIIADEADDTVTPNAIYALISHGLDGHGAYHTATASPYQLDALVTNVAALDNAGITSAGADAFDNRFRMQGYYEDVSDVNNRFDDIIVYKERKDWRLTKDVIKSDIAMNSKTTLPGWEYVPQYTLPSGKVVPGFEVMKYEASDPEADGVPNTVSGQTPWYSVTYTEARQACQKLGFNAANATTGAGSQMEYDIISESQWLSIAHQALYDSRNWTDSCYGDDVLTTGHRDNNPTNPLVGGVDDQNGYEGTGDSSSDANALKRAQRRTTYIPSGAVLWDLGANVTEWTYCDLNYPEDTAAGTPAYSLCRGNGTTDAATYTNGQIITANTFDYNSDLVTDGVVDDLIPAGFDDTIYAGSIKIDDTRTTNLVGLSRGNPWTSSTSGLFNVRVTHDGSFGRGFRCVRNINVPKFTPLNLANLQIWYDASDIDGDFSEEWTTTTNSENAANFETASAPCNATDNYCIRTWRNKAMDDYHAKSGYLNGGASGTDANRPILKLNSMNGRPTVNFSSTVEQWLDTWHGTTEGGDNGDGFSFNNTDEMTIFVVADASDYDAIVAGNPSDSRWWPFFVMFPYDMGNKTGNIDYVFLTSVLMGGADAANDYCEMSDAKSSWPGLGCMAANSYGKLFETGPHSYGGSGDGDAFADDTDYHVAEGKLTITFNSTSTTGFQGIFSKDASGFEAGGHLTVLIENSDVDVRIQSSIAEYWIRGDNLLVPNVDNTIEFTFGTNGMEYKYNGALIGTDPYTGGITNNTEYIVLGSNCWGCPTGGLSGQQHPFSGTISKVTLHGGSDSSGVNYACAKMGGITTQENGLTANEPHIISGVFKKDTLNGLSAYVDGGTMDTVDSGIQPENKGINSPATSCRENSGDAAELVNVLLNIGMNRHNTDERTMGDVAEIIIYDRALSTKERIEVEKYLSEKYDITYKGAQGL